MLRWRGGVFRALRRIAAIRYDDNNASMSARVRQVAWVAAALAVPVALAAALLPLRYHVAVHSPPGSGTVLTARLPPGDPFG